MSVQPNEVALFTGRKRGVKFSMCCKRGDPTNHYPWLRVKLPFSWVANPFQSCWLSNTWKRGWLDRLPLRGGLPFWRAARGVLGFPWAAIGGILRIIMNSIFIFHEKGIYLKAIDSLIHSAQVSVTKCNATLSKQGVTKMGCKSLYTSVRCLPIDSAPAPFI